MPGEVAKWGGRACCRVTTPGGVHGLAPCVVRAVGMDAAGLCEASSRGCLSKAIDPTRRPACRSHGHHVAKQTGDMQWRLRLGEHGSFYQVGPAGFTLGSNTIAPCRPQPMTNEDRRIRPLACWRQATVLLVGPMPYPGKLHPAPRPAGVLQRQGHRPHRSRPHPHVGRARLPGTRRRDVGPGVLVCWAYMTLAGQLSTHWLRGP